YLYAHYQYGAPVTSHIHFYYTAPTVLYTLSLHDALPILAECRAPEILRLQAGLAEVALAADVDAPDRAGRPLQARHHAERSQRIDRKSTRLNSSHVKISYAVFCLKKKNSTQALRRRYTAA